MSMSNLSYARRAYQSFSRSARHVLQLIAGHQSLQTGWAFLSYQCLSEESSLTRRRVIQLVAFLEAQGALEVHRGHGRGHVNFYRILREEDGLPVPHRSEKKVKSETPSPAEKVKSETGKPLEILNINPHKDLDTKEKEKKGAPLAPVSLSPQDSADAPEKSFISPEVARKFNLRYGIEEWPPQRRKD
jgi:hypothetical protein